MCRYAFVLLMLAIITPVFGSSKVFVLHGYASPKMIMNKINRSLVRECFDSRNYGYRSMSEDLDLLGQQLYMEIKHTDADTVSFVTHSMGALVVRSMLRLANKDKDFPVIHRMVMIAPPNEGAEIADFFSSIRPIRFILGPNVDRMRTDSCSYARQLPLPITAEVGVIVGMRGKKHGFNPFIKGDNDGLLTPDKATLGIEKDVVVMKSRHAFLTQKKMVCTLVVEFVQSGLFLSKNRIKKMNQLH